MNKLLTTLAMLSTTNAWADTAPIEPIVIPLVNEVDGLDIQMGRYEVTVAEFMRFMNATNHQIKEKCHLYNKDTLPAEASGTWNSPDLIEEPYRPVVCIFAEDAIAYADWLSDETGKPYRLPTFDEWQYAASAGKKSRFSFGDDLEQTEVCEYENVEDAANNAGLKQHHDQRYRSSANCNDGAIYHTVVGMYRPNDFGLHDMMGNVREWMQTCAKFSTKEPTQCESYEVAGSGWHWIPRPTNEKDDLSFIGSIEGFRLVLDSNKTTSMSAQTLAFKKDLVTAQEKASIEHQRLKSLPKRPEGVQANLIENNTVNLAWAMELSEELTYAIYRSYLDLDGKIGRKYQKIADGITDNTYSDQLPGNGAAHYQVFANNTIGESQASREVHVGTHQTFTDGQRIQSEFYFQYRNVYDLHKEEQHSVLFTSNKEHYTPRLTPFIPAWVTYQFVSKKSGKATLSMNVRGAKGAKLEFWQGSSLVAEIELDGTKDFTEKNVPAQLVVSNEPIQVRQANKRYAVLDWFEINYQ